MSEQSRISKRKMNMSGENIVGKVQALDKDIDEELLLDIPPPPPRPRAPPSPLHQNRKDGGNFVVQQQPGPRNALPPSSTKAKPYKKATVAKANKGSTSSNSSKPSRIESFHNAVLTNMKDVEQLRRSSSLQRARSSGRNSPLDPFVDSTTPPSLLQETMKDISTAAASTMHVLKKLGVVGGGGGVTTQSSTIPATVACMPMTNENGQDDDGLLASPRRRTIKSSTTTTTVNATAGAPTTELTALFSKWCSTNNTTAPGEDHHHNATNENSDISAHFTKMQQAVHKVVDVNKLQDNINLWKFSSASNGGGGGGEGGGSTPTARRRNFDPEQEEETMGGWAANLLGGVMPEGDDNTLDGTLGYDDDDTYADEQSQLRRLGSWGTINSGFTSVGTGGTFGTYELGGSPSASSAEDADIMRLLNMEEKDDFGHAIDPVLLERTQQKMKQQRQQQQKSKAKRKKRRTKVVQFDYPPIKSLRQYIRPDPEDLPNLFFTEQELDQIEEDRYCTMSTDDIEIVAVSSKLSGSDEDDAQNKTRSSSSQPAEIRENPSPPHQPQHHEMRPVKGRSGTPHRRRPSTGGSSEEDVVDSPRNKSRNSKGTSPGGSGAAVAAKSPSSKAKSPRLVKGVQIYLRERSTGA